jgi:hypothetical protein
MPKPKAKKEDPRAAAARINGALGGRPAKKPTGMLRVYDTTRAALVARAKAAGKSTPDYMMDLIGV